MKIIKTPNKTLFKKSEEVKLPLSPEDEMLAMEMIKHIDDSQKENSKHRPGIGLAAVQFGQLKKMIYINVKGEDETFREFLINPRVVGKSVRPAALQFGEGCLSVSEKEEHSGLVHRKNKVIIKAYSLFKKKEVTITKTGFFAIVLQHEMDHLDGKLFYQNIETKNPFEPKENEVLI